jgi:hypothetical protein
MASALRRRVNKPMDEHSSDEIEHLEAQIEALSAGIERCRKISLASKLAAGAGAIWLVLLLVMPLAPDTWIAAMAAVIGGVVMLGSNATTWTETEAALGAAQAARSQAIGTLDLRLVGEDTRTIH